MDRNAIHVCVVRAEVLAANLFLYGRAIHCTPKLGNAGGASDGVIQSGSSYDVVASAHTTPLIAVISIATSNARRRPLCALEAFALAHTTLASPSLPLSAWTPPHRGPRHRRIHPTPDIPVGRTHSLRCASTTPRFECGTGREPAERPGALPWVAHVACTCSGVWGTILFVSRFDSLHTKTCPRVVLAFSLRVSPSVSRDHLDKFGPIVGTCGAKLRLVHQVS